MATTAIWDVKGWLGKLVIYAENPDKTTNPQYYEKQDMNNQDTEALGDVIGYAMREDATVSEELKEHFVSGINCSINTARTEMMAVKKRYGKEDGIVAFHGYQSFAPNEATPEIAHEIGVRLANELWGERFQVIVATHLDKENHIHNHFVLNSVSFKDGYRYNDCTKTYMIMRKTSDRICKEFGLSVIENPKRGKAKHYGEWKAEKDGRPTWRGIIKADVDEAVSKAVTDKQFFYLLRQKGYTIKQGKDITVRPQGKERGMKLARNLGDEYIYDAICKKIISNTRSIPSEKKELDKVIVMKLNGPLNKHHKYKGLRALYFQYCFKLGILPKIKSISPAILHFLLKEDLAKLDNINKETKLLCINKIDTSQQLFSYQNQQQKQMNSLISKRKHLRYKLRSVHSEHDKSLLKNEISKLTAEIGKLRKEVILCSNIAERSEVIKEKLRVIKEDERKEESKIEHRRRSRRSSH